MTLIRRARGAAVVAACALGVPMALALSTTASAVDQPAANLLSVVTDTATAKAAGWTAQAYDCSPTGVATTPQQRFGLSNGAPVGQGAAFFRLGASETQTEVLRNSRLDGVRLVDVSGLSYSSIAAATTTGDSTVKQPAYLRLTVDPNGDGDHSDADSLFFEPALNPEQGAVSQGVWQTWNAGPEAHWSTTGGPDGLTTLTAYVLAHPSAKVVDSGNGGGLAVMGGCSGQAQTMADLGVDRVIATWNDYWGGRSALWDFDPPASASAHPTLVLDTAGTWNASAYDFAGDTGVGALAQDFVLGPGVPLSGKGSRQLTVGDNTAVTQYWRSTALDGKRVDSVRSLGYSTFAEHNAGKAGDALQQPAYMRLSIDSSGPDTAGAIVKDTTLTFFPQNNSGQQAVHDGVWQSWDVFGGALSASGPGELAGANVTLAEYMSRHPHAVFAPDAQVGGRGSVALIAGGFGDSQRNGRFAVDRVVVGTSELAGGKPVVSTTTSDFERGYRVPTAADVKRVGAGTVMVSGSAGQGDRIEVRVLRNGNFNTLVGTAVVMDEDQWWLRVPVRSRTPYRAYLAGTYGTTNITSATHLIDVQLGVGLGLSTSGGWTTGKIALNPALGKVPVRLDVVVNHRWVTVSRGTTAANGTAALKWDSARGRGYTVRAVASSTSAALGNASASHWIRSS